MIKKEFKFDEDQFYDEITKPKNLERLSMIVKEKSFEKLKSEYFNFVKENEIKIKFFKWFEIIKSKNISPVTIRNKTNEWKIEDRYIQAEHPPPMTSTMIHVENEIELS